MGRLFVALIVSISTATTTIVVNVAQLAAQIRPVYLELVRIIHLQLRLVQTGRLFAVPIA